MQDNYKIAAIIVNYNGITDTLECISSILKSTYLLDIIVVDNASDKNEWKDVSEQYPQMIIIPSEINKGFAGGNNIGINYALNHGYEYIMLLNNDTIIADNMVSELVRNCKSNIISAPIMYYYKDPKRIWYGGGNINKITGNAEHYYMNCIESELKQPIKSSFCTFVTGCCLMVHKDVFEEVGLLDDSYFMYCEDTDFCIRLNINDIKIRLISTAHLWHKVSSSTGGSESDFSIYYMTRNRLRYIKKYKRYFLPTAFFFTIISRYIRMIQYRIYGKKSWKSFKRALIDHKKGILGKVIKGENDV